MQKMLAYISMLCSGIIMQVPAAAQINWVPMANDGSPCCLSVWDDILYFTACDAIHGCELWSYDELTPPKLAEDLSPGQASGWGWNNGQNSHEGLTPFKGKAYMTGHSTTPGLELFSFDGTLPSIKVSNIQPSGAAVPEHLMAYGSKLYFAARRNFYDIDLYRYDGINQPYRYSIAGPTSGRPTGVNPTSLTPLNGRLYFVGTLPNFNNALFELDTATDMVSVITNGAPTNGFFDSTGLAPELASAGGMLYLIAGDSTCGREVWRFDGTVIKRLTDIAPGNKPGARHGFGYFNGEVYFSGSVDGINDQLYKINKSGSAAQVCTGYPAGCGDVRTMFVYKDNLYFQGESAGFGFELWRYDGINCSMVMDLYPGTAGGVDGISELNYAIYNGHLYFRGHNGKHNMALFRFDDAGQSTSVRSVEWGGKAFVFPNPANMVTTLSITIQHAESLHIVVTDVTGREVYNSGALLFNTGKHEIQIPVNGFMGGRYIYRLSGNDGKFLAGGTFVKQ